ncbi:glycerol-3-phosphate O-acyltransferase [Wigglesworthia glossinidia endosymbiont of Glossina morsitans morsitans (Yale colony)]|uniref:Glycerol-3-phosphate acyltransferase n=1 Tax=Wigglesworthia glossinidia endosymbiont of Glossina morsitans morsitans (Yale colony) TaxID=1142511 RepID=H6Q5I4_WIGGL|nr:glycerol-3-phosphate 1-O-acyltransferase PlsB [Wigglesworthia glossinidia]AFA41467.1 glycerol-3-phosphate O-acyltransferase [Wigglesworthia glossinidia endosymbiont of Glossina morsitans morsitans (Yale colony)]
MVANFFHKVLNFFINFFIKSKIAPISYNTYLLNKDSKKYIIYIFKYYSIIDILTLRTECLKNHLPDPLSTIKISDTRLPRCIFIKHYKKFNFFKNIRNYNIQELFYINSILKKKKVSMEIIFIPVSIFFGRNPNQEILLNENFKNKLYRIFKKFFLMLWHGRDTLIVFLQSLSMKYIALKCNKDKIFLKKIIRLLKIKFIRITFIIVGPKLFNKKKLLKKIQFSTSISQALSKRLNYAKQNYNFVLRLIKEISANYSYGAIYVSNKILKKFFKYAYKKILIYNINSIKKLAEKGYTIIYIPCHRSHMDYLILSYVLYNQGIVPPHIAAGINLNFWPIGMTLKLLGAFFIRRSFKGNKLYLNILQEYLKELFIRRISIEYFIEGGRSRTGIFLYPKTGMLIMTIRAFLHSINRPVALMPIYIGYEDIIEMKSYEKEILGYKKEKENIYLILKTIYKLKNLGKAYINFGKPIFLHQWFDNKFFKTKKIQINKKQSFINETNKKTGNLAFNLMVRINNATVVNEIDIFSSILISAPDLSLQFYQVLSQINFYFNLFKNFPYTSNIILPNLNLKRLFDSDIFKKTFVIKKGKNKLNDTIFIANHNIIKINYHSNTIKHLLVLPSLISNIILTHKNINYIDLDNIVHILYPFLKIELFLRFHENQISNISFTIIQILIKNNFIINHKSNIYVLTNKLSNLNLLAFHSRGFLRKLMIICCVLKNESYGSQTLLTNKSFRIVKKLLLLNKVQFLENFDRKNFFALVNILYKKYYFINNTNKKINSLIKILTSLI